MQQEDILLWCMTQAVDISSRGIQERTQQNNIYSVERSEERKATFNNMQASADKTSSKQIRP